MSELQLLDCWSKFVLTAGDSDYYWPKEFARVRGEVNANRRSHALS